MTPIRSESEAQLIQQLVEETLAYKRGADNYNTVVQLAQQVAQLKPPVK